MLIITFNLQALTGKPIHSSSTISAPFTQLIIGCILLCQSDLRKNILPWRFVGQEKLWRKSQPWERMKACPHEGAGEHHEGTSLLNGQLGPGSRKTDEGWWKTGIVWFLLHSLTQLIDIQTRMFPASIAPLCKGKCRCSRKWGRREGSRKWSQHVHRYT